MTDIYDIIFGNEQKGGGEMFFSKRNKEIDQKIESLNAKAFVTVPHITGLSVPEKTWCKLFYCEDKIVIEANSTTFNLSLGKVKDITITTDVEIQKQMVSSIGGAVAGGAMFGVLGAIIGGRAKEKTIKTSTPYLVITYESDDIKYITFDITGTPKSEDFVKLFQQEQKRETVINL